MKKILLALFLTTSLANAQVPKLGDTAVSIVPPLSNLFMGQWRVDVISSQMKPAPMVVIEPTHAGTIFWGDKGCILASRVKNEPDSFHSFCINLKEPFKLVPSVITLTIPEDDKTDLHFTVKGIENVDLWAHFVAGPIERHQE